jgi:hypothetical protein
MLINYRRSPNLTIGSMANKRRLKQPLPAHAALSISGAPAKPPGTPAANPASPARPSPRDLVLCILGVVVGVGVAMITINFWVGVVISTISALLFLGAVYWLIGNKLFRLMGIVSALAVYFMIYKAIFIPASVTVSASTKPGNYVSGSDVYGIKWRDDFYDVTATIVNSSNTDMRDLDLLVATDQLIAGAGIAPGINSCSSEAETPNGFIGEMTVSNTGKNGNSTDIPALEKDKPLASSLYRVRCERLSAASYVTIKFPILRHDWPEGGSKQQQPQWVVLWVSLTSGYRPVQWKVSQCFVASCADIPENISQVPLSIGPSEATWWTPEGKLIPDPGGSVVQVK